MVEFGKPFREDFFTLLEKDVTPLNHGSVGLTPTQIMNQFISTYSATVKYSNKNVQAEKYVEQLKLLGKYLNINYENMAFVTNATLGVNIVLRSIPYNFLTDKILIHSLTYGACANTVKFLHDQYGIQYDIVELNYPLEDNEVVRLFEEKLSTGQYKLCMFDMITSMPSVKFPYKELTSLCFKYNALSLIDGAHAVGLCDLSFIETLKPDFFVSNLHKWFFVPKSCAILYVNEKHHDIMAPFPLALPTLSESLHDSHNLINKFCHSYVQTYSTAVDCISTAISFRTQECRGENAIREYQMFLRSQAIESILTIFGPGTELLENKNKTLRTPGLFNIKYPMIGRNEQILKRFQSHPNAFADFRQRYINTMIKEFKIYVPIFIYNNAIWLRFSVAVYNTIEDYEVPIKKLKHIIEKNLKLFIK